MAKSRSTKSTLFQLLNEAQYPMYVLDNQGHLLFANQSLAAWLGSEVAQLENQKCLWTTDRLTDPMSDQVRGLAISPENYKLPWGKGKVFRTAADQHLIWRNAQFTRLSGSADLPGNVLVHVDNSDLSSVQDSSHGSNPPQARDLIAALRTAQIQKFQFDHYVGISPPAQKLNQQIQLAAATECNLLIHGPAGSGQEELARAIHKARYPSSEPTSLTPIHGAIADAQLIQQTIIQTRDEKNEATWILLLDADQLTEQAANEMIGFLELPNHDLHLIGTCQDPDRLEPRLRNHLSILPLSIPSLESRKQDLPLVANLLLQQLSKNSMLEFDEEAMQSIVDYDWPGDLDELRRTIEAITENFVGDQVSLKNFPDRFRHALLAQQIGSPESNEIDLDRYLADIEFQLIQRAMEQAQGNKAKACKLLGISRAKLGRRIQQLAQSEPIVFELSEEDE